MPQRTIRTDEQPDQMRPDFAPPSQPWLATCPLHVPGSARWCAQASELFTSNATPTPALRYAALPYASAATWREPRGLASTRLDSTEPQTGTAARVHRRRSTHAMAGNEDGVIWRMCPTGPHPLWSAIVRVFAGERAHASDPRHIAKRECRSHGFRRLPSARIHL